MSDEQNTPEEPQETLPAAPQPYRESEDHVPDPTAVSGTLETSGTGGGQHARLEGVAAIFDGSVTQQTVERDGLPEHLGAVVQNDTTGLPVPDTFAGPVVESETEPEGAEEAEEEPEGELSPEVAEEVAKEAEKAEETPAPAPEAPKPVAKKTAARKTAAADPKK